MSRDYQKQRVYNWEAKFIPKGKTIPFEEIPAYIAMVWEGEGLQYPPRLEVLHKNVTKWAGYGARDAITLRAKGSTEHVILHELAHSMTANINGSSDAHGPNFVGVAMKLYTKYLGVSQFLLWHTAKVHKVDFEMFPRIQILDGLSP